MANPEHGLTWSLLLGLKRRFSRLKTRWSSHWFRNWLAEECSFSERPKNSVFCCVLPTFQVEVWKKFWKLSPPKVSIFRVCLRTL